MDSSVITIHGYPITVNTYDRKHVLCLNEEGAQLVPGGYDVTQVRLCGDLRAVNKVGIRIGDTYIPTSLHADGKLVLPEGGIQMSRTWAVYTQIVISFSAKYIDTHSKYKEQDEYKAVLTVSEELDEFVDEETGEVRTGYLRRSEHVKTGKKVRASLGAQVDVPDVEVIASPPAPMPPPAFFWDEFVIDPYHHSKEYVDRLAVMHSLVPVDGGSIEVRMGRGLPFKVRAKNVLRYSSGMVERLYTY